MVCLVDPIVAYQISHGIAEKSAEALEIVEKASLILLRQFCKAGILGIPIWAKEHWTLLVLRKMEKEVQVRYCDSLKGKSEFSASVADYILEFLRNSCAAEFEFPIDLPEKSNIRSMHTNGIDCGFFLLHYWEGEVRRWIGEGWSVKFPTASGKCPI